MGSAVIAVEMRQIWLALGSADNKSLLRLQPRLAVLAVEPTVLAYRGDR